MIVLTVSNLAKRYGATRALTGLSMRVEAGFVIGIAGPNGAGKSTLMRILSGEERPDAGEIRLVRDGTPLPDLMVAAVHQEPHLWPNLTVRQNLAVGREQRSFGRIVPGPEADTVLAVLGIAAFADFELADLSLSVHQRVEIARAIMRRADVFLFDEPNSALTDAESKALFALMAQLAADGKIVLLITHRLNDFANFCAKVLILRDGRIVAEIGGEEPLTEEAIAAQLAVADTNRIRAPAEAHQKRQASGESLMTLAGCSDSAGAFHDITIDVPSGRVLVLAGVEGSGARELAQAIGGFRPMIAPNRPSRPLTVAYLAASRRHTVFANMSVGENIVVRVGADRLAVGPWLSTSRMRRIAREGLDRYVVKDGDTADPVTSLSGGNQQKVVLGAALEMNADILVIEEPTRGVDMASKQDIYGLLRRFCGAGKAVVLFCTEVPEMFDIADDIVVMSRGTIVGRVAVAAIPTVTELVDILARFEAGTDGARL